MTKISPVHWRKFEKFLFAVGCTFKRQTGSHRVYTRGDLKRPVIVTCHGGGTVPPDHIRTNLRTLGIEPEEYVKMMKKL